MKLKFIMCTSIGGIFCDVLVNEAQIYYVYFLWRHLLLIPQAQQSVFSPLSLRLRRGVQLLVDHCNLIFIVGIAAALHIYRCCRYLDFNEILSFLFFLKKKITSL